LAVAIDSWKPDPDYAGTQTTIFTMCPWRYWKAGRACMRLAASLGDIADDDAQPLVDSVIGAALPLIRE
jgi:hypothetical protein